MSIMKYICTLVVLIGIFSCNLENEIEIELPEYDSQVVVEAYLEPGKPFNLLLSRSSAFFDPFNTQSFETFLDEVLENDADVRIRYNGIEVILGNALYADPKTGIISNYVAGDIVPEILDTRFELDILLSNGDEIQSSTTILPKVPFDSLVVEYSDKARARIITYLTDIPEQENYFRRVLSIGTLDSLPDQDFLVEDKLSDNGVIAFGTGFEFLPGDTVINSLWHISKEYFDFLESVVFSVQANLDPITQPGMIISNVYGSANPLGIFTGISLTRDTTIIE